MLKKQEIWVVIPAYNEARRIGAVLAELKKERVTTLVVDDGSNDDTSGVVKRYGVKLVKLDHNFGKGYAMRKGAEEAFKTGARAVIFIDADGQHKLADLDRFVDELTIGKRAVVFGSRNLSLGVPFFRYVGSKVASVLVNLLFGIYVSDLLCGYRGVTKEGYEQIRWISDRYGVETEMVIRVGQKKLEYSEVPVEVVYLDAFKGVSYIDAMWILIDVIKWKVFGLK